MIAVTLVVGLGLALAVIVATFVIARRRGRYDTVDTAWGVGFAAIALVSLALSGGSTGSAVSRTLPAVLTVVWGLRLAIHLHLRNRARDEDPRYTALVAAAGDHPAARMFVRVYLTQAALMWVVSLPVPAAMYGGGPGVLGWVGVAVSVVGIGFEAVGDRQLARFRADPENRGRVLDTGLWRYTRHPNYFGDACVWWGLYLLACHTWLGAATIVSPVVMTALLAKGTGKPMLERSLLLRRPAYAAYVARTSGFVPLPPKRS